MPPNAAPTAPVAPAQPNAGQTAANIAKGVQDKANGKAPATTQAPAKGAAPATSADPNAGKQKYVVGDKEYWLTPQQAAAYVQKGIAFEPRVSELDRVKRDMEALDKMFSENPGPLIMNWAKKMGVSPEVVIEKILDSSLGDEKINEVTGRKYWEKVGQRMRMDPKELALLEAQEKLQKFESEKKSEAEKAIALENQKRFTTFLAQTSAFISEAMKKSGFSNTDAPAAIQFAKIAGGLYISAQKMRRAITPDQAVEAAHKILNSYLDSRDDGIDDETFIKHLGDKRVKRVQQWLLKKAKEVGEGSEQEPAASRRPAKRSERETITPDQMHDYLDEIKRTGSIPGKK